jgi:transposase
MPKIYPEDRKFSVKQVYAHSNSIRKTADILEVSKSTVHRWLNDATKSIPPSTPQIKKSTRSTKLMEINDLVDASIQLDAFLTCRKLQAIILENMSISVSKELVRLAIIKLGYSTGQKLMGHPDTIRVYVKVFLEKSICTRRIFVRAEKMSTNEFFDVLDSSKTLTVQASYISDFSNVSDCSVS